MAAYFLTPRLYRSLRPSALRSGRLTKRFRSCGQLPGPFLDRMPSTLERSGALVPTLSGGGPEPWANAAWALNGRIVFELWTPQAMATQLSSPPLLPHGLLIP